MLGSGVTVGGTTAAARNIISGNAYGVVIQSANGTGDAVEGNYIGTDITGTVALGNLHGVTINEGGNGNVIGGTALGAGNLISGNIQSGVLLEDPGTSGNLVDGERRRHQRGGHGRDTQYGRRAD